MKKILVLLVLLCFLVPVVGADYTDAYFEISKGNVPGHSVYEWQGVDEIVQTTEYVIWGEDVFVWPTTAISMNVSSGSANDDDGNTGAWNVTIYGLDMAYNMINETVVMNGQAGVPTMLKYFRINRLDVERAGATESNVGRIYIGTGAIAAGKPAVIYNEIRATFGRSSTATYTVPNGLTGYVFLFSTGTDSSKIIELSWRERDLSSPDNSWRVYYHDHYSNAGEMHPFELQVPISEHTDIKVTTKNSVGSAYASCYVRMVLVEDGYTLITNPTQDIVITESEVDLLSNIPLVWMVFVALGSVCTAGHKLISDKAIRGISFSLGVVLWVAAAYIWAVEYAETGFFPIIWVHLIPILLLSSWALFDERGGEKRDKYE